MILLRCATTLMLSLACTGVARPDGAATAQQHRDHPELSHRPAPNPEAPQGRMKLDVLVTDASGHPVTGLQQENFTLLDNKKPQPILSFRSVDGSVGAGPGEPPAEVILLIDATNTPLKVVGDERNQIERFLRRNGGRLMQPTSLMIFDDYGLKALADHRWESAGRRDGQYLTRRGYRNDGPVHF